MSFSTFSDRLAGVFGEYLVKPLAQAERFAGVDLDVRRRTLEPARHLMDQYLRIRENEAFTFSPAGKQQGAHRHGDADADGGHVGLDELHGVVDGQARVDVAARAVDVEGDVLVRVLGLQMQQLGDDQVGHLVVDGGAQEDDALVEQARVDVERALASAGLLDDHGDQWTHGTVLSAWSG